MAITIKESGGRVIAFYDGEPILGWDRVLTAEEMKALYDLYSQSYPDPPTEIVDYWRLH